MISIITKIQIEGNDVVSFLNGTAPPYQYVQSMSQIMPQVPTYISYGYDSISITQTGSKPFEFSVYTVLEVGGISFTALTFQDASDVVQAKTIEIYRLLVTSIFKGCCPCGDQLPQCAIQYLAGEDPAVLGTFQEGVGTVLINYFTANNQDFTGFWPIVQDGSWIFVFSKTDPTVYAVYQLSSYVDGGTFAQFNATLLDGPAGFPVGTELCIDVTSVGGSLVQDWQDTLNISSVLTQDNTVDGGNYDFVFDNNNSFTINSPGGTIATDVTGASLSAGSQNITVTAGYIDIITPAIGSASTGWVLALTSSGHVEYVEAGTGTISSIELIMPPAFTVSTPNPLTSNGSFTVDGAGTDLEYINGLGELATLPVYTVENGLHAYGGEPGETPADPYLFHLGGLLVEDTTITATNGSTQYVLGVSGTVNQNTRRPFSATNLGNGGIAVFSDYGTGTRPNPSVEILTDNDLSQPILNLHMQGNLPDANNTMLRLRYSGRPDLATTTIDYQFRNNNAVAANSNFIGSQLSTEVVNFVDNSEQTRFNLQLMQGGTLANRMQMEGFGQLILNNYATGSFANATANIDNTLEYVLAVKNDGTVWKKSATGGGTVQSISAAGLLTTSPNPITVTGTVTTSVNENRLVGRWDGAGTGIMQEITVGTGLSLSTAGVLTADGSVPVYTVNNGLEPQTLPAPDPNNFQLGGPLVRDTTITGATNAYDLNINDLKTFNSTSKDGYNLTAINGGYLNLYNSNFYVEINDGGGNSTSIDQYANGLYVYASGEIDVQSTDSTTINSAENNTVSAGISNYFNALTNNEISSDVNTEVYSKVSTDITSVSSTNIRSGSGYSNYVPIAGNAATVYVTHDMTPGYSQIVTRDLSGSDTFNTLFMKSANSGSRHIGISSNTAGTSVGMQIGIASGFSASIPTILFQTPNVFNGSATVGQVLTLKSMTGTDKGRVEFEDAGGGGGTYDSDQGIYKDTSLTNDTFMLGAPSGSQASIAFSIDRYIDTTDQFLQIEGANGEDGSVVLKVIEGSGIPLDTKASFISATNYKKYAGSFTGHFSSALLAHSTAADGNTLEVINVGTNGLAAKFQSDNGSGIQITSQSGSAFQINGGSSVTPAIYPILDLENLSNLSPAANGEGVSITMSPGVDAFGTIDVGVSLNAVISDIGTIVGNDSVVDFRVDTLNLGTVQQHTSFIGSGQLQLHEYTTATAFQDDSGASIGVLNVDSAGNVFVGGGGGTTYTVDNGLSPQTLPTANPDNFQLGGPLVLSTTIDGVATYDLSFTNIKELTGSAQDVYFEGSDGVNNGSLVLAPSKATLGFTDGTTGTSSVLELSNAYSRFIHSDGTTSSSSAIELTGTELRVQTPLYTTKNAGDVLTLLDPLTGESEWSTPTGGGSGLEAILMLMGS